MYDTDDPAPACIFLTRRGIARLAVAALDDAGRLAHPVPLGVDGLSFIARSVSKDSGHDGAERVMLSSVPPTETETP